MPTTHPFTQRWMRSLIAPPRCVCFHPMRLNHVYHKCRPSLRQLHHTSPGKSPTSFFRSSVSITPINTSRCAIAPLSAATGYLPAVTISSRMSGFVPIGNTSNSSPTSFNPRLSPSGFHLSAESPWSSRATVNPPIAMVTCTSPQDSLCTNSGVDVPTWNV